MSARVESVLSTHIINPRHNEVRACDCVNLYMTACSVCVCVQAFGDRRHLGVRATKAQCALRAS